MILDVDGVLTDGRIGYAGEHEELKFFDVKDGLGIAMLRRAGLLVGILSGRSSRANRRRAEELGIDVVIEGQSDKLSAFRKLLRERSLVAGECLYMGDDLLDAPVLQAAGVGVTVPDGAAEIRSCCDWVTEACGGRGAVREVAERILREQGRWAELLDSFGLSGS